MGLYDDRVDMKFKMYCIDCRYSYYPYFDNDTKGAAFSKDIETVFNMLQSRECPECKHKHWGHNL